MTLEEAKKILKKEGFVLNKIGKRLLPEKAFIEYEGPDVCEAMQIIESAGFGIGMELNHFDERKARLKEERKKHSNAPMPVPGEEHPEDPVSDKFKCEAKLIGSLRRLNTETLGEQSKEKKGVINPSTSPKADFYYKHVLNEGNPALEESASQFNDALLDELRKKIAAYKKLHFYDTKTLKRKDEIIEELRDKNAELLGMVERMKEDVKDIDTNLNAVNKTNKCLNKKVVELTKIKGDLNSWISGLYFCIHHNNDNYKYKLKRLGNEIAKLNGIIHDKNAVLSDVAEELRLTKIREKNLTELGLKYVGENEKLKKELADKVVDKIDAQALKSAESALAWKEKVVTYKDMALAYYEKKIAEKDEVIADLGNELAAFKESYKRRIKEDSEHFEHIQKICNAGLQKWLIESEYLEKDKPFCFPQLPDFSKEEEKKLSLFRDDSVGAVTNQKDCSHVKDTHPTEDNPEEIDMDEILEYVRKALEKGHTVSIDYDKAEEGGDQSATIVECGKDIDDVFEEIKRLCQE